MKPGAVFLHTGWRSSGTWLWNQARSQPRVRAFYEPLHEGLASLRTRDIGRISPGSWRSNHADAAPYFEEYRRFVAPRRSGVAGYEPSFAFDTYFLGPDDASPALEAYLRRLTDAEDGMVAVLKFCRSLGRVAWLERRFPDALHAVVLRDPASQWASAQRLLLRERNRYFVVAPLLVLARNAHRADVRQACSAMEVCLPPLFSADLAYGTETAWRHYRRQDAGAHYRTFLAFWTLTAARALAGEAMLIDPALLAASPGHRREVEAAFAARLHAPLDLTMHKAAAAPLPPNGAAAQLRACRLAETLGAGLRPERLEALLARLAPTGEPVRSAAGASWAASKVPPPATPGVVRVALAVGLARAVQPLRRLHGAVSGWWWGGERPSFLKKRSKRLLLLSGQSPE